jgi:2-polyprenyl-6-methoxyphenol hydroxylase-like FAD-dependent oxidoreductase
MASVPSESGRAAERIVECDVAIVGYGPTGMTLAALLGQRGRRVVVLERYEGLYNLPRAACFDDEIMRIFQQLGIVEEVTPGTVVQSDYEWVNADDETLLEITYDESAPAGWPALYMMYQPHLEDVLDGLCRRLDGVEVRQGTTVVELEPGEHGAVVTACDAAGTRTRVQARFVVGADGGAGFVRQALGIGQSDYGFSENWLVCDFEKLRPLERVPSFRQVCDPAQPTSIVRIGPRHHRFSFMLDPDEPRDRATDPHRVWARVARYLSPEDATLIRAANYRFRSRIADTWRRGPVMLAGDAAHEMPPFLAQGMCSGIRDSYNLSWKLDLVLTGRAGEELLETYQPEREPHVRFITERAIELGRVQTLRDAAAAAERDRRLIAERRSHHTPPKIVYPGMTSGLIASTPSAGERLPQGLVEGPAGRMRLDDAVEGWPLILVRRRELLDALDAERRSWWCTLGGAVEVILDDEDRGEGLVDATGLYAAWFADRGCEAVIVRPDWYVYGTANGPDGLVGLLDGIRGSLRGDARLAPSA